MRKAQKIRAESYAELLSRAHLEVKKALESKNMLIAMNLLEQCQTAAIELGNFIEAQEGEGFATIPLLEEYCEALFQFHELIRQEQEISIKKIYKTLNRWQICIENSVKNDIRVRSEVVFLPYKASMWDALESVWMATKKDPDCDAYVIPIPYYDKSPDGSFREIHYEGDLYPDYVPVIRYDAYDFAERQPDVIFIHNPYDECNYVTSVHPFFYSKNLKKYTEKLVYIPYFTLNEVDPQKPEQVEKIQHFILTPGVFYADRVIVQSENMRQVYIRALTKELGEETRRIWQDKILGLGSPKYDKVVRVKKEDLEIPEEWQRIIRKTDGTQKKIILYNTSVSAILRHGDRMLEKIKSVLQTFQNYRDEVALLWRPHPLIKATIASMRPELWSEYEKLVLQYVEDGWGIYDDSPDLDRALVLSDAYYGDGSSLVRLYQKLGKPIMLQNVECL